MPTGLFKAGTHGRVSRHNNSIAPKSMLPLALAQPAECWELSFEVDDDATEMCWARIRPRCVAIARIARICSSGTLLACDIRRFQAKINAVASIDFC